MKPGFPVSPEVPPADIRDASTQEERVRLFEQDYQRQSRTLRMSQLNTAPILAAQNPSFESPQAFQLSGSGDFGVLSEIVASKDLLLVRCKATIEGLEQALKREKYFSSQARAMVENSQPD